MNKEDIQALQNIYAELVIKFQELEKNPKASKEQCRQMAEMLRELRQQAKALDIDLESTTGKVDNIEDWKQLIYSSQCSEEIEGLLINKIESLGISPSAPQMWAVLKNLDAFYTKSVTNVESTIKAKYSEESEARQQIRIKKHQAAGLQTIKDQIKTLDAKLQLTDKELGITFNSYLKDEKSLGEQSDSNVEELISVVDGSDCHERIKAILKAKLAGSGTAPSTSDFLKLMDDLERYYETNVLEVKDNVIEERVKVIRKGKETEEFKDMSDEKKGAIRDLYRKSAFAATIGAVQEINPNSWSLDTKTDIHPRFVDYFSEKASLKGDENLGPIPFQVKFDIANDPLKTCTGGIKPLSLKLSDGSLNVSVKMAYFKAPHAYKTPEKAIIEEAKIQLLSTYDQYIRQTVTLPLAAKGFKIGTTVYTRGFVLFKCPYGDVVLKVDLGSFDWTALAKNAFKEKKDGFLSIGPRVAAQLNVDIKNLASKLKEELRPYTGDPTDMFSDVKKNYIIQKLEMTVSLGFKLGFDALSFGDFIDRYNQKLKDGKKKKPATTPRGKDDEAIRKLQEKGKKLKDTAGEIRELQKEYGNKVPKDKFESKVKKFQRQATDLMTDYYDRDWIDKSKADDVLKKIGKESLEELGEKALKSFARIATKAIPVVGQVLMVIDTALFLWDVFSYLYKNAPEVNPNRNTNSGVYGKSSPDYHTHEKYKKEQASREKQREADKKKHEEELRKKKERMSNPKNLKAQPILRAILQSELAEKDQQPYWISKETPPPMRLQETVNIGHRYMLNYNLSSEKLVGNSKEFDKLAEDIKKIEGLERIQVYMAIANPMGGKVVTTLSGAFYNLQKELEDRGVKAKMEFIGDQIYRKPAPEVKSALGAFLRFN